MAISSSPIFVDFDMVYGHRRDVPGYAAALEQFDLWLPDVYRKLGPEDMVILTADHGCDPTWRGTDHTRERVPIMAFGPSIRSRNIGIPQHLCRYRRDGGGSSRAFARPAWTEVFCDRTSSQS